MREQFGIGAVRADPVEELADLPLPAAQVRPQDLRLGGVVQLPEANGLDRRPTRRVPSPAARTFSTHWVSPRGATRYRRSLDGEHVHRGRADLAGDVVPGTDSTREPQKLIPQSGEIGRRSG